MIYSKKEKNNNRISTSPPSTHLVKVVLLLLELLLMLLQELLVLLLHHQLLQGQGLGMGLRSTPLGQRRRLGAAQRPVLSLQLGHGGSRRHGQTAYTWRAGEGLNTLFGLFFLAPAVNNYACGLWSARQY